MGVQECHKQLAPVRWMVGLFCPVSLKGFFFFFFFPGMAPHCKFMKRSLLDCVLGLLFAAV